MNNVNSLSNMNSVFKEIYADKIQQLFGMYNDFKWEGNKYYYDPTVFMRKNPFMGIINNTKAPYTEKVDKKTLILEIE